MVLVETRPNVSEAKPPTISSRELTPAATFASEAVDRGIALLKLGVPGDFLEMYASLVTLRANAELFIRREKRLSQTALQDLQGSVDFHTGIMRQELIVRGEFTGSVNEVSNGLSSFERATARAFLLQNAQHDEANSFMREWAETDAAV